MSRMTGKSADPNVKVQYTKTLSFFCRDKRIFSTGCAGELALPESLGIVLTWKTEENTKMNDCYFEKKDWRLCRDEVRDAASGFSDSIHITCMQPNVSNALIML
jgi:hypothetical protein